MPKPHPPLQSRHHHLHGPGMKCTTTDKHFTVRDGFHLKSRNDEKKLAIDQQLLPQKELSPPAEPVQCDAPAIDDSMADAQDPSTQEISLTLHRKLLEKQESHGCNNNNNAEDDGDIAPGSHRQDESVQLTSKATTATSLSPPPPTFWSSHNSVEAKAIAARIEPSSEWLIYRQRADLTLRRHDQRVEEMIQKVLQPPTPAFDPRPQLVAPVIATAKENELFPPTRPRQPSLSGSTYHQRVLATRQKNSPRTLYPLGELAPLTETERSLLNSREEKNRDVDRLLVTLFQQQQQQQSASGAKPELSESLSKRQSELKFSTRRSVF